MPRKKLPTLTEEAIQKHWNEFVANVDEALAATEGLTDEQINAGMTSELHAFRSLAGEAQYYVKRWPKLAPEMLKRLAAMSPGGAEKVPSDGGML